MNINYLLISFNFMPILPLDGGKLLNILLNKIMPYKISNIISLMISVLFTIVFIITKKTLFAFILTIFLFKCIIIEIKNLKYKQNKFILERYLNNPSKDNILILICDKLDARKKLVKLIDKKYILGGEVSIEDLIHKNLEDYKMDYKTTNYLIDYCDKDNEKILNELEKLKCYKLKEKAVCNTCGATYYRVAEGFLDHIAQPTAAFQVVRYSNIDNPGENYEVETTKVGYTRKKAFPSER